MGANVYYVATNGNDKGSGTNWSCALRTIEQGVIRASNDDTVLVAEGTYYLTGGESIEIEKGIMVVGISGAGGTFIDGRYGTFTNRCVVLKHKDALLAGFTITNGCANSDGGGLQINDGMAIACMISGNRTTSDGVGQAGGYGGGVEITAGVLDHCVVQGNLVEAGEGGGVYINGTNAVVRHCLIKANRAKRHNGGGVLLVRGIMENSLILENVLQGSWGGGVALLYDNGQIVRNCIIRGNTSGGAVGGGISCENGGIVRNCLIENNCGGGVYLKGHGILEACTIANNFRTNMNNSGCGINVWGTNGLIENCIVYNNYDGMGNVLDGNIMAFSSVWYCCISGKVAPGRGNIAGNPLFIDAKAGDFHLASNSPCLEAGRVRRWMKETTDLCGIPRSRAERVDMGAYAYVEPTTIKHHRFDQDMVHVDAILSNVPYRAYIQTKIYEMLAACPHYQELLIKGRKYPDLRTETLVLQRRWELIERIHRRITPPSADEIVLTFAYSRDLVRQTADFQERLQMETLFE